MENADPMKADALASQMRRERNMQILARLPEPDAKNDLIQVLLPGTEARTSRKLYGFETLARAQREMQRRSRCLAAFGAKEAKIAKRQKLQVEAHALLGALIEAPAEGFLGSFADPRFFREMRRRLVGELLRLVRKEGRRKFRIYTIVSSKWNCPGKYLNDLDSKGVIERFRSQLNRVGLSEYSGFMLAFFDASYVINEDVYEPHFHILCFGEKYKAIENLRFRREFEFDQRVRRPIVLNSLIDAPRQLSYLMKPYWHCVSRLGGDSAQEARRRRRMKMVQDIPLRRQVEKAIWLDERTLTDLVWLHGITLKHGRLVPKP